MDLYIDKENLRSFLNSRDKEEFDDCLRMLRRQLHLVYNMDKTDVKNDSELLPWILKIGEGRGKSEETDTFLADKFPIRPIKSNSYNDWSRKSLLSAYLIDDFDVSKLKNKGCVLLGDVGEELVILTKLFCGRDYEYHHLYDLRKNFLSWEQLTNDNQLLPCTDIIISDRYLFSNQQEVVEYNLSKMLKALAYNVKNRIDVVVYTLYGKDDRQGYKQGLIGFGEKNASKIIKDTLYTVTGIKPNVTFVCSNDNDKILHDRFVITNYRLLRSGDSFNYFDTNGKRITNGGSLDVDSLANHETYVFVESLLEKLQSTYNTIKGLNDLMILGDRKSKFLTMT